MKIIINTQYRENYAAHDEDFVPGVSENYWKFKGGSTYVVPSFKDRNSFTQVMKTLDSLITYGNSGSEEYILSAEIVEDNAKVCESWETATQIFFNTDNVTALRVTDNREDGYMRSEIFEKTEVWKMLPDSGRQDYAASYLMQDGDIVWDNPGLEEWFTNLEAA